jgi:uncharacterized protein YecT (DUF1311 family)
MKKTFLLLAIAAASFTSPNPGLAGESSAEEFGARRWPSAPTLEVNEEPKLCGQLLAAATEAFLSNNSPLNIVAEIESRFPPVPMEPVSMGDDAQSRTSLYRADLDLDGDGKRQTVIYRDNAFNWSGNWHYSYVFPSPEAFEAVKEAALTAWRNTPEGDQYPPPTKLDLGAQQYFPSAVTLEGNTAGTGNVWAPHALFAHEGRYFFPFAPNDFDLNRPFSIPVYRLRASGRVQQRCRISTGGIDKALERFRALPAIASYLTVIRRIGDPGPDQGTLHAAVRHDAQAEEAVIRAASRPWTLPASTAGTSGYFVYGPRMTRFLEQWSALEPWNRREYQTLLALMTPAADSYAAFLRTEFGMSDAMAKGGAKQVVEGLLASRILIPSHFEEGPYAVDYFPVSPLHQAVMLRNRKEFEATVATIKSNAAANNLEVRFEKAEYSRVLLDSVEWSYAFDRLLELGADPNQVNGFGKSVLMTAAHLDRIDAVVKVLRAGAKVNVQTTEGNSFEHNLTRTRRTALMYAAENASPVVIKALLEAGADASLRDSQGNDVSFYLANNPRFTETERRRGIEAIAVDAEKFSRPSFDCGRARTDTELSICTSAALRAFDIQIANAFTRLAQKPGSVVRDQRAWLRYRDGACSANDDTDCLAEIMRTRLRYLHMRLME